MRWYLLVHRLTFFFATCIPAVSLFPVHLNAQVLEQRPTPEVKPATGVPQAPNSYPVYQQLRSVGISGKSFAVNHFVLKRDAGEFTFASGTFYFLNPVEGKITGAIFQGQGTFHLTPPIAAEQHSLSLLTNQSDFTEEFNELILRFTDGTAEEIQKSSTPGNGPAAGNGLLDESQNATRKKLHYNLEARILQDLLSQQPGGLFWAFIKGKKYDGRMIYAIDPHGLDAFAVAPEEVALMTYGEAKFGIWTAFHRASEYASGSPSSNERNRVIHIDHQKLGTQIQGNAHLHGDAVTTVVAQTEGLRVVPFDLFRTLRVSSVTDASGQQLSFVQEDQNDDPNFSVILTQPLHSGESFIVHTVYSGKDAVINEGGDNYYPVAREDWYPNTGFGEYETYEMTFHIPKGMTMVASATPINSQDEGGENVSEWKSEVQQAVAGFNFGRFKRQEVKLEKENYLVEAYANTQQPEILKHLARSAENDFDADSLNAPRIEGASTLGALTTTSMMKKAMGEGQSAIALYTEYFGPAPYKRLAMTQQTAPFYGQSWPGLVYLPLTSFLDETTRHQLGIGNVEMRGYFTVVAPHEVAHQWWGHTVGFNSYRDQWMSEGFADFSASLFLQSIYGMEKFQKFWKDEKELLTLSDRQGYRAIDVGPVTQGYRVASTKTGFDVPRLLIYPKGAYILHMLRMMMWDQRTGDENFKAMMHDFVTTYANKAATTEDFKAMVEKHMLPVMDLDGNHKMDWFFDSYVYGTALPNYKFETSYDTAPEGTILNVKLTQSNVDDKFKMIVPIYLEMPTGKVVKLGAARIVGNHTFEKKIPLTMLKDKPKGVSINYYSDVLCTEN